MRRNAVLHLSSVFVSDAHIGPLRPDAVMLCAADFPRRNADEEEEREKAREWAECPRAPPTLQVCFRC